MHPGAADSVGPGSPALEALSDLTLASLAVAPGGVPEVVVVDRTGAKVSIGRREPDGLWTWNIVLEGLSVDAVHFVIDEDGVRHVAMRASWALLHATDRDGDWATEEVQPLSSPSSWTVGLAVDGSGDVHLAVQDDPRDGLVLLRGSAGDWELDTLPAVTSSFGLAVDRTGVRHVVWESRGDMHHDTDRGGQWRSEVLDCELDTANPTIAVDDAGTVHVAWERWSSGEIWYAQDAAGQFVLERVERPSRGRWASWPTAAVDPSGTVYVSYWISDPPAIALRVSGSGAWPLVLTVPSARWPELQPGPDGDLFLLATAALGPDSFPEGPLELLTVRSQPDPVDPNCDGLAGVDSDRDGHASTESGGDDCDDSTSLIRPGSADVAGDGVDHNCSGVDGDDVDGDGFLAEELGGTDCDDRNRSSWPGAFDGGDDGIDSDCDGADD